MARRRGVPRTARSSEQSHPNGTDGRLTSGPDPGRPTRYGLLAIAINEQGHGRRAGRYVAAVLLRGNRDNARNPAPASAIARRDRVRRRVITAGRRPTQQGARAPSGAQDSSFAEKQEPQPARLLVVPSERGAAARAESRLPTRCGSLKRSRTSDRGRGPSRRGVLSRRVSAVGDPRRDAHRGARRGALPGHRRRHGLSVRARASHDADRHAARRAVGGSIARRRRRRITSLCSPTRGARPMPTSRGRSSAPR